ncbi:hypothetical protein DFA_02581 [Cavenderia fasciculata]|uniref:Uncharacterized protein n=1 Tax=Cavenderia fasciculata TaxID=261658 RepID=F4PZS8_CACFS|nr:uncharacterized protein DFA_02581 [Cavenderia fasciculata]EGG18842.1 hypothetical protein DFA_02581 [Cavenderia fasciculata]|eukprot:XP_004357304.1 hypothetical protein DFA_02581 [Cavenderia fasciculata]
MRKDKHTRCDENSSLYDLLALCRCVGLCKNKNKGGGVNLNDDRTMLTRKVRNTV